MQSSRKSWWAALLISAAMVGCDTPAPPSPVVPPGPAEPTGAKPAAEVKPAAEPEKKVDIKDVKLSDDEIAEVKKIEPEADRKLALEQKVCPIGGDNLGAMGVPVKVVLKDSSDKDQTVFLCCSGCVKKAKAEPAATLAKLGKK